MAYLAYKTKLKLNNQQKTLMRQCAGYRRWLWNWGLNLKQKSYEDGIKLTRNQKITKKTMYSIEYLNNQGGFTLVAKNASKKVVDLWISAQGGKYETIVVTWAYHHRNGREHMRTSPLSPFYGGEG